MPFQSPTVGGLATFSPFERPLQPTGFEDPAQFNLENDFTGGRGGSLLDNLEALPTVPEDQAMPLGLEPYVAPKRRTVGEGLMSDDEFEALLNQSLAASQKRQYPFLKPEEIAGGDDATLGIRNAMAEQKQSLPYLSVPVQSMTPGFGLNAPQVQGFRSLMPKSGKSASVAAEIDTIRNEIKGRIENNGTLLDPAMAPKFARLEQLKGQFKQQNANGAASKAFQAFDAETRKWYEKTQGRGERVQRNDIRRLQEENPTLLGGNELSGIAQGALTGAAQLASPLMRLAGQGDEADRVLERAKAIGAAQQANVKAKKMGWLRGSLNTALPGVVASGVQAAALGGVGGALAMPGKAATGALLGRVGATETAKIIGKRIATGSTLAMGAGFGATTANDAYAEAKKAGLPMGEAAKYAAIHGALETGIMLAFQGLAKYIPGIGGFEEYFSLGAKRLAGETGRQWAWRMSKGLFGENVEENLTTILQQINSASALPGAKDQANWFNPKKAGFESFWDSPMMQAVRDTTNQTMWMMGLAETTSQAGRLLQRRLDKFVENPSQENYAKAAEAGLSETPNLNREKRAAVADAVVALREVLAEQTPQPPTAKEVIPSEAEKVPEVRQDGLQVQVPPVAVPGLQSAAGAGVGSAPASDDKSASVPVFITRGMDAKLEALGYTESDIDKMKPADAWALINDNVTKPAPIPPVTAPEAKVAPAPVAPTPEPAPAAKPSLLDRMKARQQTGTAKANVEKTEPTATAPVAAATPEPAALTDAAQEAQRLAKRYEELMAEEGMTATKAFQIIQDENKKPSPDTATTAASTIKDAKTDPDGRFTEIVERNPDISKVAAMQRVTDEMDGRVDPTSPIGTPAHKPVSKVSTPVPEPVVTSKEPADAVPVKAVEVAEEPAKPVATEAVSTSSAPTPSSDSPVSKADRADPRRDERFAARSEREQKRIVEIDDLMQAAEVALADLAPTPLPAELKSKSAETQRAFRRRADTEFEIKKAQLEGAIAAGKSEIESLLSHKAEPLPSSTPAEKAEYEASLEKPKRAPRAKADAAAVEPLTDEEKAAYDAKFVESLKEINKSIQRSTTLNAEDKKDAKQNAYIRGLEQWRHYDPSQDFVPWIVRVAQNQAVDLQRKGARERSRLKQVSGEVAKEGDAADVADRQESLEQRERLTGSRAGEVPGEPITRDVVQSLFPGRQITKLPHGWRIEIGEHHVDIEQVPDVRVDWAALERAFGVKLSPSERVGLAAAGVYRILDDDGRQYSGLGLIQLANGDGLLPESMSNTLAHESIHLARRVELIKDSEWAALVKEYSKPGRSDLTQEEDVARARERFTPRQRTIWQRIGAFFRNLLTKWTRGKYNVLTGKDVFEKMGGAAFWDRYAIRPGQGKSPRYSMENVDPNSGSKVITKEEGATEIKLGINMQQMMNLVGPQMYSKPIQEVAAKELLQNAFDAARQGGATDENPGRISITSDRETRILSVKDEGVGMTPEIIRKAFFTIGGTHKEGKPENTSGGLGLAKMAFILGSRRIKLVTTRDGITSTVDALSEQIRNSAFKIHSEKTGAPSGTYVEVEIPMTFPNANGEDTTIYISAVPDFFSQPLIGPVDVSLNGETLPIGANLQGYQLDNEFQFSWGKVNVYVDPKKAKYPEVKVLSAGLYQFNHDPFGWSSDNRLPYNIILDVRPSVRTDNAAYPFNNQREDFRSTIKSDIEAMNNFFQSMATEQSLLDAKDTFASLEPMPKLDVKKTWTEEELDELYRQSEARRKKRGDVASLSKKVRGVNFSGVNVVFTYDDNTTKEIPKQEYVERSFKPKRDVDIGGTALDAGAIDPNVPHFHNNTTANFDDIPGATGLFAELGNTLLDFMRMFGEKDGDRYEQLADNTSSGWFGGVSIDKSYRGLNMVKPLKAIWFNPAALSDIGLESPEAAASEALHIFIHEITHVRARNEGAAFTSELANNYARLRSAKMPIEFFEQTLVKIFTNHWDALGAINERVSDYNTENRAQSFKSAASLGTGRPQETSTADDRASEVNAPGNGGVREQGRGRAKGTGPSNRNSGAIGDILGGLAADDFAPRYSMMWRDNILDALRSWQPKGTPQQLEAHLKKFKGTKEQGETIGLGAFLDGKSSVSKVDVENFVKANQVQLVENQYSDDPSGETQLQIEYDPMADVARIQADDVDMSTFPDSPEPSTIEIQVRFNDEGRLTWINQEQMNDAAADWGIDPNALENALHDMRPSVSADGTSTPHFAGYQLPGGKRYREFTLSLPVSNPVRSPDESNDDGLLYQDELREKYGANLDYDELYEAASAEERERLDELDRELRSGMDNTTQFHGGHFPTPNIIVHVRANERVDATGKKTWFIEEIQSDWHQEGRKKGYEGSAPIKSNMPMAREAEEYLESVNLGLGEWGVGFIFNARNSPQNIKRRAALVDRFGQDWFDDLRDEDFLARERSSSTQVPDAPFKQSWPMLAFKRMAAWASERGYEQIAWTTGKQQVERYPDAMRAVADKIEWHKSGYAQIRTLKATKNGSDVFKAEYSKDGTITSASDERAIGKPLSDVIGKEMAKQILDSETSGEIAGKDFTVGGKGMEGFYDVILPAEVNKYVKPWGVKVGTTEIVTESQADKDTPFVVRFANGTEHSLHHSENDAERIAEQIGGTYAFQEPKTSQVHAVPIPPAMRESVIGHGQPMYSIQYAGGQPLRGRPDLANPATRPVRRSITDQVDEERNREGLPETETDEYATAEATRRMEADFEGEYQRLLGMANGGAQFGNVETVMAKRYMDVMPLHNLDDLRDRKAFVKAYRSARSVQARALRQGRDLLETPAQRRRRTIIEALATSENPQGLLDILGEEGLDNIADIAEEPLVSTRVLHRMYARQPGAWNNAIKWYWTAEALSSVQSLARNAAGAMHVPWDLFVNRTASALANAVPGRHDPFGAQLGELPHIWKGFLPALSRGVGHALIAWQTGRLGRDTKWDTRQRPPDSRAQKLFGWSITFNQFTDAVASSVAANTDVAAKAYRIAKRKGLTGRKMSDEIYLQTITPNSEAWALATSLAQDLTFKQEGGAVNRTFKRVVKAATSDIPVSKRWKIYNPLFHVAPFVTATGNILGAGIEMSPFGAVLLANRWNNARMERNDIQTEEASIAADAAANGKKSVRNRVRVLNQRKRDLQKEYVLMDRMKGQQVIAWAALLLIAATNDPDDPWLTGSAPRDPQKRDAAEALGKRFNSINFSAMKRSILGGERAPGEAQGWYDYSGIEPFATGLTLMADVQHAATHKRPLDAMWDNLVGFANNKTYMKGVADVLAATQIRGEHKMRTWAAGFIPTWMPWSGLVRGIGRASNENRPERGIWGEGQEMKDRFWRRVAQKTELGSPTWDFLPDAVDAVRPPKDFTKHDHWGQPLKGSDSPVPGTDFVWKALSPVYHNTPGAPFVGDVIMQAWNNHHDASSAEDDDEANEKYLGMPAKTYTMLKKTRHMTDEQWDTFTVEAGTLAKARVQRMFDAQDPEAQQTMTTNPSETQIKRIATILKESRAIARRRLLSRLNGQSVPPLSTAP